MACNENIVKNMANEVTRNCLARNYVVDSDFVVYLINLLLLNPKYGKLFTKTLSRTNLEYFVNECVSMILSAETAISTLKMQHIMQTNYDQLQNSVEKHLNSINERLEPLLSEILEEYPEPNDEAKCKKLFRKISIYIILASGLGNPGDITTLREGMAALGSVFSLDDLKVHWWFIRSDKKDRLTKLVCLVSGVRLFNRDCKKGGETITDLPHDLVDAGKACLSSLSNSLIMVMQQVNSLTSAVETSTRLRKDSGDVEIVIPPGSGLKLEDYKLVFELLAFGRQYELFIRKLLADVEVMVLNSLHFFERFRQVLDELHSILKFKAEVPVVTVYPLFMRLWQVWQAMQKEMFLLSSVNKLMTTLANIQEQIKTPHELLEKMLQGKTVMTDKQRMSVYISLDERLSMGSLKTIFSSDDAAASVMDMKELVKHVQYLGFCAICLCVGALVPSNLKVGTIKRKGCRYGFCSVQMAQQFSKDPHRYIMEILHYARNNPHIINLLNIAEDVDMVKDLEILIPKLPPLVIVRNQSVQTELHPVKSHIDKDHSWNLWEWKKRACQWDSIVKCATHSTQTYYSHMRSEIQCQTVKPLDKCLQTKRDIAVYARCPRKELWGLRGKLGDEQHWVDLTEPIDNAQISPGNVTFPSEFYKLKVRKKGVRF